MVEYWCYDYLRVGIWSWFRVRSMFQMISGHIYVWLMLNRCDSSRNRNSATPAICIFVCNYYIISCLGFYIVKEQLHCVKRFCNIEDFIHQRLKNWSGDFKISLPSDASLFSIVFPLVVTETDVVAAAPFFSSVCIVTSPFDVAVSFTDSFFESYKGIPRMT